jgi:molybdate transport system substrate-binding protein
MFLRIGLFLLAMVLMNTAHSADLMVLSAAAMKGAFESVPERFFAATGNHVSFQFGTAGFIRDKATGGEAFDLAVIPPAPLGALVKAGLVTDGTIKPLGLVRLAAAVKSGTPHPAIATVEQFKSALLTAPSIGIADPASGATSGIYLDKMFDTLGIGAQVRAKLKLYPEGQTAMEAGARGEVALGLGQMSEIVPVSGMDLVGTIPDELQLRTTYSAGLGAHSARPEAARALLEFLAGPEQAAVFARKGFEPPKP